MVERPASIVKGGRERQSGCPLRLTLRCRCVWWREDLPVNLRDNGGGIHKDDLALAVERRCFEIKSPIPRSVRPRRVEGEALASVASVSRWLLHQPAGPKLMPPAGICRNAWWKQITLPVVPLPAIKVRRSKCGICSSVPRRGAGFSKPREPKTSRSALVCSRARPHMDLRILPALQSRAGKERKCQRAQESKRLNLVAGDYRGQLAQRPLSPGLSSRSLFVDESAQKVGPLLRWSWAASSANRPFHADRAVLYVQSGRRHLAASSREPCVRRPTVA